MRTWKSGRPRGVQWVWVLALAMGLAANTAANAEPDAGGCKDGALPRMSGFYINDCDQSGFDHHVFAEGTRQQANIQGPYVRLAYAIDDGVNAPTQLAVLHYYAGIFKQAGWVVVGSGDERWITAKRGGQWAEVSTNGGANYEIFYVDSQGR